MKRPYLLAVLALSLVLGAANSLFAVVVSPSNMNGWTYYKTNSSGALGTGTGTADFVLGPATPPEGTGSGHFQTPAGGGNQSVQARLIGYENTPLASLTALSYSTYATQWNGQQLPYLQLYLDLNGDSAFEERLVFEPAYSSAGAGNGNLFPQANVALNTWQTWDMLGGMVYSTNGPSGPGSNAITFSSYLASHPTAKIVESAPGVGGIRLTTGFGSTGDNFDANIDNFTIGTLTGGVINYDFEVAAVPEASAFWFGGAICGVIGLWSLRQRRKVEAGLA